MPSILLKEVSVDTNGTPILGDGAEKMLLIDSISMGGGTITLQVSRASDNSKPWVTLLQTDGSPAIYTSNTCELLNFIGAGAYIRAVLSSSSGANAVNVALF